MQRAPHEGWLRGWWLKLNAGSRSVPLGQRQMVKMVASVPLRARGANVRESESIVNKFWVCLWPEEMVSDVLSVKSRVERWRGETAILQRCVPMYSDVCMILTFKCRVNDGSDSSAHLIGWLSSYLPNYSVFSSTTIPPRDLTLYCNIHTQ
jgi:hypothetical protein